MKRRRGNKYMSAVPQYKHKVCLRVWNGARHHASPSVGTQRDSFGARSPGTRRRLFAHDVAVPTAEERRRRETMLARVMLLAVDLVLSGEGLGLETARDLVREIKHTFPELQCEWNSL